MDYAQLTQAVQDYTENTETTFVANIPLFIRQAEERITRVVQIPELRKNVTGNMTAGNRYMARPSDILSVFSFAVIQPNGDYTYMIDKDMNFMREAYPNPATTGVPRFYAMYDGDNPTVTGNFLIGPTPSDNFLTELQYYYDPPSIVDTGTSWLGENAETALLYGTLLEAYTFMKGDADLMTVYKGRYDDALAMVGILDVKLHRDSYRDGEMRSEK
ncbi:MAG: hypothetical protein QM805_07675 [Pseudomonas sp.]